MATNDTRPYRVQLGKGKGSYRTSFELPRLGQAVFHYNCLNVHSGYKKRLLDQAGRVVRRELT